MLCAGGEVLAWPRVEGGDRQADEDPAEMLDRLKNASKQPRNHLEEVSTMFLDAFKIFKRCL